MKNLLIVSGLMIMLGAISCSKSDDDGPAVRESRYGQEESHRVGSNCMECHGSFTVAGSVYGEEGNIPFPNATVYLLDAPDPDGDTLLTIEVDGLGNFYTDQEFDFNQTVYTSVMGDDTTIYKRFPVANGACNSCHNQNAPPVWTK